MEARLIGIEFGDGQRMRRVVSRSNYRVTGKHPSWKRGRMVYWESPLERDAFRRLDADSSVAMYEEQPAKISYSIGDKTLNHYPDILITGKSSRGFLEVKSDRDADRTDIRERTAALTEVLHQSGFSYRVWRESEIRAQPALDNAVRLLTCGRRPVPFIERERIRRLFVERPVISWEVLTTKLLESKGAEYVSRLVIEGMLVIDRETPLTATSPVSLSETERSPS